MAAEDGTDHRRTGDGRIDQVTVVVQRSGQR